MGLVKEKKKAQLTSGIVLCLMEYRKIQQHCSPIPVLSVPRDMLGGFPGGYGCCSPELGKSPVEMYGLLACWVGWVLTGVLSGTKTGAAGLTGHSKEKEREKRECENVRTSLSRCSAE